MRHAHELAQRNIFVTGATGFIGGRVCERLIQAGVPRVRTLVHGMHRAPRIARMPVELCPGDLQDKESLRRALRDAKIVIHCGLGPASTIVRGTENILQVALAAGVQRFVHISTAEFTESRRFPAPKRKMPRCGIRAILTPITKRPPRKSFWTTASAGCPWSSFVHPSFGAHTPRGRRG